MVRLSVNVNKVATLRNARGGQTPNLVQVVRDCEQFGAQGITIHPRPDERHIRFQDVYDLKQVVTTEYNIEGYPNAHFLEMMEEVKPEQVTLVPDPPGVLTSNAGWNMQEQGGFLQEVVGRLKATGTRVSLFMDPDPEGIALVPKTGADRIELYTEAYADGYAQDPKAAIAPYIVAAQKAQELGLGLNAGHDLSLENLQFFAEHIPGLLEVSIGHALISDALYFGLENTINMYLNRLK